MRVFLSDRPPLAPLSYYSLALALLYPTQIERGQHQSVLTATLAHNVRTIQSMGKKGGGYIVQ
jgi:hypothetical protein